MEMMSVSFYVLVSFQRSRSNSLEAGVKYLILSALRPALLVFGIALIFGTSGQTNFAGVSRRGRCAWRRTRSFGWACCWCCWAGLQNRRLPDADVGAGCLSGSADAGDGLPGHRLQGGRICPGAARVVRGGAGAGACIGAKCSPGAAVLTILYGNLCAIPQRSLKRLLGYSSIANAGYLLLGVAALNAAGSAAVLYYLAGYVFTLAAAFIVICLVARDNDDIGVLAGLNRRSPVAGAGVDAGHGFAGGHSAAGGILWANSSCSRLWSNRASVDPTYLWLAVVAVAGVVISYYYYFGVIRAIYWSEAGPEMSPIAVPVALKLSVGVCIAAMLYLGLGPDAVLSAATEAVTRALQF